MLLLITLAMNDDDEYMLLLHDSYMIQATECRLLMTATLTLMSEPPPISRHVSLPMMSAIDELLPMMLMDDITLRDAER